VKKALFLFYFLAILSIFSVVNAESKPVIINEIMWMGSSVSTADEWIELKNNTEEEIDLSGWVIEGAGTSGSSITIPLGKKINANGYFLISNYSNLDAKSILDITPNYVTTSVSLKNEFLKISLKDSAGNLIDEAGSENKKQLAGNNENKFSMQRVLNYSDGTKSADWYTAAESKGIKLGFSDLATPGFENSKDISRDITNVSDAKNSTLEVTIQGFVVVLPDTLFDNRIYIFDADRGLRIYLDESKWPDLKMGDKIKVRGKVQAYYGEIELKVIDKSDVKIEESADKIAPILIKTGDFKNYEGALVKIIGKISKTSGNIFYINDSLGEVKIYVKDELEIDLPDKHVGDDAEIIGIINNWNGELRILPRFLEDIKITYPQKIEEIKDLPIIEVKKQQIGTKVKTRGVVSVEPGRLGKTIFYIQDENSGIQIYSWYKDFPLLKLGDFIEVIGELSEMNGELRIKIKLSSDIKVLENKAPPIFQKISIINTNNFLGRLVKVKGTITKSSGNTFYINDGSGTVKIYIKDETGIKKPKTKKGDIVEIVGIASVTEAGLRILPRYKQDFRLVWSKPLKGKVLKASTYKRPKLNQKETILEAKKVSVSNKMLYIAYGALFLFSTSVLLFKNVKLNK
jgi:DNA/RNA endonuclease YhcR with UshA esterase domain